MPNISRRHFIATAACAAAAARINAQSSGAAKVSIALPSEATGPHMPADFVGLSYEVQQLTDPNFFSPANTGLMRVQGAVGAWRFAPWRQHQRVRLLEADSRFAGARASARHAKWWASRRPSITPSLRRGRAQPGSVSEGTGWTCLYGIGMGTNMPERAAARSRVCGQNAGVEPAVFPDRQ